MVWINPCRDCATALFRTEATTSPVPPYRADCSNKLTLLIFFRNLGAHLVEIFCQAWARQVPLRGDHTIGRPPAGWVLLWPRVEQPPAAAIKPIVDIDPLDISPQAYVQLSLWHVLDFTLKTSVLVGLFAGRGAVLFPFHTRQVVFILLLHISEVGEIGECWQNGW